ncbi:MAG: hypothetical protein KXJ61_08615 [Hydrogenophaga sp.]|uniref:pilus assembly PilX family protein n=1 Tax=Hydrogenophaga sp. TaxID=1904254 RepID=UPI001D281645|nr:PilX N-terminal domain-containing pilus assembly protein [Hydrogenophaga sp.]MBW0170277.1 hypothetical protein [Hydrogenophaga sp.]MBW0184811.1 hypothetical protein [Hydrogenophaga sp.]
MTNLPMHLPRHQKGISLITVMVMLLLSTLIVLSATRLGWLHEKLVGSESDHQRAFAAAEALNLREIGRLAIPTPP